MSFYEDERITYPEAEEVVEEYTEEKSETRTYVSASEVCRARDIEPNQHNQHRVRKALKSRFEQAKTWASGPLRFVLTDD